MNSDLLKKKRYAPTSLVGLLLSVFSDVRGGGKSARPGVYVTQLKTKPVTFRGERLFFSDKKDVYKELNDAKTKYEFINILKTP